MHFCGLPDIQSTHTHTLILARHHHSFSLIVSSHSAESVLEPTRILIRKYKHESICLLWTGLSQQRVINIACLCFLRRFFLIYTFFFYSETDFNLTETEFTPKFRSNKCSNSPLLTKTTGNKNKTQKMLQKYNNTSTSAICVWLTQPFMVQKDLKENIIRTIIMYKTLKFLSKIWSVLADFRLRLKSTEHSTAALRR